MKLNLSTFSDRQNDNSRRTKEQTAARIDTAIKLALDELHEHRERQGAFLRLLACVRAMTPWLKPKSRHGTAGWVGPIFLINRLKNLAARQGQWIRSCETWRPDNDNLRLAFRSLAAHLLTGYPVPGFMDSAWDLPIGAEGFRQQSWYIRLGRGVSFRALNLPLILTRNMEHHVRQAPDHYTVMQALRYGETRGLGGSKPLAREVAAGRLGQKVEHHEFWRTVISFFAAHPKMELEQVNPIIDFIQANKFAGDEVQTANGPQLRRALWPDFSMKGRTLKSLLRLSSGWHLDLAAKKLGRDISWRKSGIQEFEFLEKRPGEECDRDWSIRELLSAGALLEEGRAMRHCVYTYTQACRRGETTIWSLRLRVNGEEKRVATIEVNPHSRAIVQMRTQCNRFPGERTREIIVQWAKWAGLQMK